MSGRWANVLPGPGLSLWCRTTCGAGSFHGRWRFVSIKSQRNMIKSHYSTFCGCCRRILAPLQTLKYIGASECCNPRITITCSPEFCGSVTFGSDVGSPIQQYQCLLIPAWASTLKALAHASNLWLARPIVIIVAAFSDCRGIVDQEGQQTSYSADLRPKVIVNILQQKEGICVLWNLVLQMSQDLGISASVCNSCGPSSKNFWVNLGPNTSNAAALAGQMPLLIVSNCLIAGTSL